MTHRNDAEIVARNVRAIGPIIAAAMFEALKAFEVADRIVALFRQGMLPIGSGGAGRLLDRYWRDGPNRLTASERRSLYEAVLGIPGGDPAAATDRAFDGLWLRFVSAVVEAVPSRRARITEAGHALSAELSRRGTGAAAAARLLQAHLTALTELFQDPEIRRAFGARDMWQVIDRVAADQLGGAANSARYWTLATSAATIIDWLAERGGREREMGLDLRKPADRRLVEACKSWLAYAPLIEREGQLHPTAAGL